MQSPGPGDVIDVAAAVIFKSGKLLITQRRLNDHLGGLWEFPGGKVEPNENFRECLVREIREELGIEIEVFEEIEEITHSYPEKTVRLKFFRSSVVSGEAKAIACHDLAWITRGHLRLYQFPAADARLLEKLESGTFWDPQV